MQRYLAMTLLGVAALGAETPEEHAVHTRVFNNRVQDTQDLRDLAAQHKDDAQQVEVSIGVAHGEGSGMSVLPGEEAGMAELRSKTCAADMVMVARMTDKRSDLTEDGRLVFTEYQMKVEHILKQDSGAPLSPAESVMVLRLGGTTSVNGKTVRVVEVGPRSFNDGSEYLLFLSTTGSPKTYEVHAQSSWQTDTGTLLSLMGKGPVNGMTLDTASRTVIGDAPGCTAGTAGSLDR